MTHQTTGVHAVIKAAEKLIDAVTFDVSGADGRGGNGGLTSSETVRASDELRLAISRFREGTQWGEWRTMKSAPRNGKSILLWLGETIPDVPDIRLGGYVDKTLCETFGHAEMIDGGWMIWNSDCDWFVVECPLAWAVPPLTIKPEG